MPKYTGFTSPIVDAPREGPSNYAYRAGMGIGQSAEFVSFFDDFTDAISSNAPTGWTAIIDTGATLVADTTIGVNGGACGACFVDSAGAGEGVAIYKPEVIQLVAGKRFFMETRVDLEAATDCDFFFGLSDVTATTNPEDLWLTAAASFVACGVRDSSATGYLEIQSDLSNAGPVTTVGSRVVSSAQYVILGLGYDGSKLRGYINGKLSLTHTGLVPVGVTLAPFVGYLNGSAATNECSIDYVRYVMER